MNDALGLFGTPLEEVPSRSDRMPETESKPSLADAREAKIMTRPGSWISGSMMNSRDLNFRARRSGNVTGVRQVLNGRCEDDTG